MGTFSTPFCSSGRLLPVLSRWIGQRDGASRGPATGGGLWRCCLASQKPPVVAPKQPGDEEKQ